MTFPDRRAVLFGRDKDLNDLAARAAAPGLTALLGLPTMGKTWLLEETARRLSEHQGYLVGYHENTGFEASQVLYALSKLYTGWLQETSFREQARIWWSSHSDDRISSIGQMFGGLISKLGGSVLPEVVASSVSDLFDALAEAQRDLKTGGLQLAVSPVEQARALLKLVSEISQKPLVLILDSWDKSPALKAESALLENYLKHPDEWPLTHLFVGIRHPELDARSTGEAAERMQALCGLTLSASILQLGPMDLSDPAETARCLTYLRESLEPARPMDDAALLDSLAGYPGVISRWLSAAVRPRLRSEEVLLDEARQAHAQQYLDLEQALQGLKAAEMRMACRVAFAPELTADAWVGYQEVLTDSQDAGALDALYDKEVLEQDSYPTFGPGLRHSAARRWLITHEIKAFRLVGTQVLIAFAARVTESNWIGEAYCHFLITCHDVATQAGIGAETQCVIDAAYAVLNAPERVCAPSFEENYSSLLFRHPACAPLIGSALIARAIFRSQDNELELALVDLDTVLSLDGLHADQVGRALARRAEIHGEAGNDQGAIDDYTTLLTTLQAPTEVMARAYHNRAIHKTVLGFPLEEQFADYTAVIELPEVSADQLAGALINRATAFMELERWNDAIKDLDAVIDRNDVSSAHRVRALINRAVLYGQSDQPEEELAGYFKAADHPGAPPELAAQALLNAAQRLVDQHKPSGASEAYERVIRLDGAPAGLIDEAQLKRSRLD